MVPFCAVLRPGKSCRITVRFTPTAAGARTAIVRAMDPYSGFVLECDGEWDWNRIIRWTTGVCAGEM